MWQLMDCLWHHSTEMCGLFYVDEASGLNHSGCKCIIANTSYKQFYAISGIILERMASVNICAFYVYPTW